MYSDILLRHVLQPRNCGELADATHMGMSGIPGDGPYVVVWLRIHDSVIADASYETYGCPASIGTSSALSELIDGKSIEFCLSIEPKDLVHLIGGLPEGKEHCADRAICALRSAMESPL